MIANEKENCEKKKKRRRRRRRKDLICIRHGRADQSRRAVGRRHQSTPIEWRHVDSLMDRRPLQVSRWMIGQWRWRCHSLVLGLAENRNVAIGGRWWKICKWARFLPGKLVQRSICIGGPLMSVEKWSDGSVFVARCTKSSMATLANDGSPSFAYAELFISERNNHGIDYANEPAAAADLFWRLAASLVGFLNLLINKW